MKPVQITNETEIPAAPIMLDSPRGDAVRRAIGPRLADLSNDDCVDWIRGDQRARWQRGERVAVEVYIAMLPAEKTTDDLLLDLIYGEWLLRLQFAEAPVVDEYVQRFPGQAAALRRLIALDAVFLGEQSAGFARAKPSLDPHETPLDAGYPPPGPARAPAAVRSTRNRGQGTATEADYADLLSPPEEPGEIGRLGPYRMLKVLGAGAMGVVFLAEDTVLKRTVAVKTLKPGFASSREGRERFLREARMMAAVKHENIVTIHHAGEHDEIAFLAMECLAGESLEARLKREPLLPAAETLEIGRAVADGLAAAHARGLIHRDIKPANLWLEPVLQAGPGSASCRVKILDFGLARAGALDVKLTQAGAVLGTPAYMAPEQAAGESVDARADLFSLGVVMYRMATGNFPFQGNDLLQILRAIAVADPCPPHLVHPALPGGLSDLIMQLLAKSPAERCQSADQVATRLRELQHVTSGPARASGKPVEKTSVRRVWPGRTAIGIAAGLLAIAVIAVGIWRLQPGPPPGPIEHIRPGKHDRLAVTPDAPLEPSKLAIDLVRDGDGPFALEDAVPVRTGNELRLSASLPARHHGAFVHFSEGKAALLQRYAAESASRTIAYPPAPGTRCPLEGEPGTELFLFLARKDRPIEAKDVSAILADLAPFPPIAIQQALFTLNEREVKSWHRGALGKPRAGANPEDVAFRQLEQLRENVRKRFDVYAAVLFVHKPADE